MSGYVAIGDKVMWRGGFGNDDPKVATVIALSTTRQPHEKYGRDVKQASWDMVREDRVVFTLDNGHWAYGTQIEPIS